MGMKSTVSKNVLLLVLIALPLAFVPATFFSLSGFKFTIIWIAAIFTAFGVLVSKLNAPTFKLPLNIISISGLAVVLLTVISAFASESVATSFFGIGYSLDSVLSIVSLFILFSVASYVFSNRADAMRLHSVVIVTSIIVALWQALRFLIALSGKAFPSFGYFENITDTTIGSFNDTAIFLGLGLVIAMVATRFLIFGKKMRAIVYALSVLSVIVLLIINFSLLWYILGISAIAVIGYAMSYGSREGAARVPIFPLVIALLSCAMIIAGPKVSVLISQPFGIDYVEVRPDWRATADVGWSTIKHDPILGVGPSRFVREWHAAKSVEVNETIFWNFDFLYGISFLATTLTTVGILGFLAWLTFVGSIIVASVRAIMRAAEDKVNAYLTVSSGVITIFLWTFSIFYVPGIVIMAITFIFTGAFVGLMVKTGVVKTREIESTDDQRYHFIYVFVIVSCMMLVVIYAYLIGKKVVASVYFDQAQRTLAVSEGEDIEGAIAKAEKGLFFNVEDTYYRAISELRLGQLAVLTNQLNETQQQPTDESRQFAQQLISAAVANAQQAIVVDPTNHANYLALARVYRSVPEAEGSIDLANQAYDEAQRLAPTNPGIKYEKAIIALIGQDYQKTLDLLVEAVQMKSNFVEAARLYIELDAALKNRDAVPEVPADGVPEDGAEPTETGAVGPTPEGEEAPQTEGATQ